MFVQIKKSAGLEYVYIIESYRKPNGTISHRTIKKLGRLDDFTRDDPDAVEKLREQVRKNSKDLRVQQTIKTTRNISKIIRKKEGKQLEEGLAQLNYANYILKNIWNNTLKLDYRIGYLQKQYHSDLKFSLSHVLFYNLVIGIVDLKATGLEPGSEIAMLGESETHAELVGKYQQALELLSSEETRIMGFVLKKISEEVGLSFLNVSHLNPEDPDMVRAVVQRIGQNTTLQEHNETASERNAGSLSVRAAYGTYIMSVIRMLVLRVLKKSLDESGLQLSYSEIRALLRQAVVLVDFPLNEEGEVLYIKPHSGSVARQVNQLMTAVGLLPLLNIQDRVELSRRLRAKLISDSVIIPPDIMELNK